MSGDAGGIDAEHAEHAGRRGERRWLPTIVVLVLVCLPFLLPESQRHGLHWVFAALELPLLVAIVVADPGRVDRRTDLLRTLSTALIFFLVLAAAFATVRLVHELLEGAPQIRNATTLLVTGFLVWLDANLTFSLLYWQLDSGGAATRLLAPVPYPDFAFPQQFNPELAPPGWVPTFPDYLHLGLTNALAFSPTDVMPLVHWAKLTMALQSIISITILSLVVANAVNLLGS